MKKLMILTGALAAFAVCADKVPAVSGITMTQSEDSRLVTIDYTLANAAAVVTLDIQTNVTGNVWVSIGGENVQNVSGAVWKNVEEGGHTITWRPDLSWPDHRIDNGGARAVVTAWSVDNPPDYLVVDLSATGGAGTERYYPAVEFLPGGLLKNPDYRTTKLVMRKIPAKGVAWTMGSVAGESGRDGGLVEKTHGVTLADNYYIGVFETTQAQWALVQTANETPSFFTVNGLMRPVERVSYNEIRNAANSTKADTDYDYPNDPNPGSFLGLLRTKTGLLFDLPSEAQWEFACRAGHGTGSWGNGKPILSSTPDANLSLLGRYCANGGRIPKSGTTSSTTEYADPGASCDVTNATAIVGSYTPNSWGLYDMHGNVCEWCLDWFEWDITAYGGAVNVDPSSPTNTLSGTAGGQRALRDGSWYTLASKCRAARRNKYNPDKRPNGDVGFRLALPACPTGVSNQ